jgi:hypothetical protein
LVAPGSDAASSAVFVTTTGVTARNSEIVESVADAPAPSVRFQFSPSACCVSVPHEQVLGKSARALMADHSCDAEPWK